MKNEAISFFVLFKKYLYPLAVILLICSQFTSSEQAGDTEQAKNSTNEDTINDPKKNEPAPSLTYYIDNEALIEDIKYDSHVNQSQIESIDKGELLILKHLSKSKKKRGNILFLHTDGESANHHRLIRPLAIQMSQLGWNVYIPNLAKEDFKKPNFGNKRKIFPSSSNQHQSSEAIKPNDEANASAETATNTNEQPAQDLKNMQANESSSKPKDREYYFKTPLEYQSYIDEVCDKVFSDTNWLEQPRILILNQTSGYWGLNCLLKAKMPTIFLDPQLPLGVENNLDDIFAKQSSSFYVFYSEMTANTKMASFAKALSTNQWVSKNQRYSQNILPKGNLNIEDTNLAKRITGWAEKLRKKP